MENTTGKTINYKAFYPRTRNAEVLVTENGHNTTNGTRFTVAGLIGLHYVPKTFKYENKKYIVKGSVTNPYVEECDSGKRCEDSMLDLVIYGIPPIQCFGSVVINLLAEVG